jgi:cytochrome P450
MAVESHTQVYDDRDDDPRTAGDVARRSAPVARRAVDRGWEILGHAEVVEAANDPGRLSSRVSAHLQLPNGLDGEEHRAYRDLIDRYLTADRVSALEPTIRDVARTLVGELLGASPAGRPVALEAVADLGAAFAVRVQTRWLGWPESLEPELRTWIHDNHAAFRSGGAGERAEVAHRFDRIIHSVLAPRRDAMRRGASPADVTMELMMDDSLGRPLTEEEIVSILRNWTGGDLGSLALCVGVILQFLATHPALRTRIASGVSRRELAAVVDEILRIDDPFVSSRRVVACPHALGGVPMEAGETVRLNWTSANRDDRVFRSPDDFDPAAHAAHNLVYGAGPHACPGRELATAELCILVEELLGTAERIEPDPDAAPVRAQSPAGGHMRVPLLLWPRPATAPR